MGIHELESMIRCSTQDSIMVTKLDQINERVVNGRNDEAFEFQTMVFHGMWGKAVAFDHQNFFTPYKCRSKISEGFPH